MFDSTMIVSMVFQDFDLNNRLSGSIKKKIDRKSREDSNEYIHTEQFKSS